MLQKRLEEKQRVSRKKREDASPKGEDSWQPLWFRQRDSELIGGPFYEYAGGYWEAKAAGKWDVCPDIF